MRRQVNFKARLHDVKDRLDCYHFTLAHQSFLDKANRGGPDTINYKEHKYCQMGVAASILKVSHNL